MDFTVAIPLLTAHLIGDFVLQPDSFIKKKSDFLFLHLHSCIQLVLILLFLGDPYNSVQYALAIYLTHISIDYIKVRYNFNSFLSIIFDQILHISFIFYISYTFPLYFKIHNYWLDQFGTNYLIICVLLSGFILITKTGDILISNFLTELKTKFSWKNFYFIEGDLRGKKKWNYKVRTSNDFKGGKYIGILERSIIYLLFLIDQPSSIGFLIAAKSIMRFSAISNADNKDFVEYVLIGTLSSFAYSIAISFLVIKSINFIITLLPIQ